MTTSYKYVPEFHNRMKELSLQHLERKGFNEVDMRRQERLLRQDEVHELLVTQHNTISEGITTVDSSWYTTNTSIREWDRRSTSSLQLPQ
eukprot:3699351-Amphidinium_carterae.1